MVWMFNLLFIEGHFGCLQFGAIMNEAAITLMYSFLSVGGHGIQRPHSGTSPILKW